MIPRFLHSDRAKAAFIAAVYALLAAKYVIKWKKDMGHDLAG